LKRHRFLRVLPLLVVLFLIGSLAYQAFLAPNRFRERTEIPVKVSRGSTFREIADSLEAAGIIENKMLFQYAGRLLGWTTTMKVGRYVFKDGISNYEILSSLRTGRSIVPSSVTIPEGLTSKQIARILARDVGIDSTLFLHLVNDSLFSCQLGIDGASLEGYLMPDTYQFYWQMAEQEIIRSMVQQFQKVCGDTLARRAPELGLTPREILTLASIVEGEALVDSERVMIAGVFFNRLKRGMKLEADPTIQYLLSDGPRRVFYRDLLIDSPYNTYLYPGLPPTPISNPGKKSILATLNPGNHEFLYFVSDGAGGHIFSKTYEDHQKAVQRYRKLREMAELPADSASH